jgi:hypothetical protein
MGRKVILLVFCATLGLFAAAATFAQDAAKVTSSRPKLRAYMTVKPAQGLDMEKMKNELAATGATSATTLPLFLYNVQASRDQNDYTGVMVGANPFTAGGGKSVSVLTHIVPVIIITQTVGVSLSSTNIISTRPGSTTFDPTAADNFCLNAPNNVPLTLFQQSPLFNPATFDFGGTIVGTTEYSDAFQRGNFWEVLGDNGTRSTYHTLVDPVQTLKAIVLRIPAKFGTTLPLADFPSCGPLGIIDINYFDFVLTTQIIPNLPGVNPSNLPIFLLYNTVLASPVTDLNTCCILGYHGTTGFPIQTYSPGEFDTTGLFGPAVADTAIFAHEIDEWMDDPFGNNPTPAWGGTGQVVGACQNNLEVGDPLTGTDAPPIVMSNGFTYHLQELAFFSWFFGAPSIGIHGWFSNNGTFLTDAGPVCQSSSSAGGLIPPK